MKLLPHLKLCIDKNGSDLFFTAQAPAQIKVEGELFPIGTTVLSGDFIRELADSLNTPFIQELSLDGRPEQVRDAMEQSSDAGMQTFGHSLLGLYRQGVIPLEEALANADSHANLEARINFG